MSDATPDRADLDAIDALDAKWRRLESTYDPDIKAKLAAEAMGCDCDRCSQAFATPDRADLRALLKDDVRKLAFLTPEDWRERRGGDPIARTINAVFDIIDARLATPDRADPE